MTKGYEAMLDEARDQVRSVSTEEAALMLDDEDVVFVDIRDVRELEREGMIKGAKHAPRGMLEFWIDPASPYHKPYFAQNKLFLFYCASAWRSLLAAQTAQEMGLNAASMEGGFSRWKEENRAVASRA